jgi:hypothetical protein
MHLCHRRTTAGRNLGVLVKRARVMVSIVRCLDWYRGWDSELELGVRYAVGADSWLSCYFYFVGAPSGEVCEGVLCGPWVGLCFVMGVCAYLIY